MKRIICLISCVILCLGAFVGCTKVGDTDKSPNEIDNIKWTTYDYSFSFKTNEDCKGVYTFENTEYDVKVSFESEYVTVTDNSNNKVLWEGQWQYQEDNKLYIYNVSYNTKDYKDFETNFMEFYTLKMEKIKK